MTSIQKSKHSSIPQSEKPSLAELLTTLQSGQPQSTAMQNALKTFAEAMGEAAEEMGRQIVAFSRSFSTALKEQIETINKLAFDMGYVKCSWCDEQIDFDGLYEFVNDSKGNRKYTHVECVNLEQAAKKQAKRLARLFNEATDGLP